jgi:hypothetical protein
MTERHRKTIFRTVLLFLTVTLAAGLISSSNCANIYLTLNTTKSVYGIGEKASLWGNVTFSAGLGGGLIPDALVAIQVDNPQGNPVILRTKTTGQLPVSSNITILSLTPCDQSGNPLYTFRRGTLSYFKASLNNTAASRYVQITLNMFDARNVAYESFITFAGLLYNGTTTLIISDPVPQDISPGNATAYLNVFTALPAAGGFALCPESSAVYSVIDGSSPPPISEEQPALGFYNLTFLIDNYQTTRMFRPGNYSVFANCKYQTEVSNASRTFEIVLTGDINRDGIVDIFDAILLSGSYNAVLGEPRWNANADFNFDGIVDIYDAIILANNFGKKA